ncbi:MAG: MFS transporter [Firmicutes bacterium]|nr:MFS transporter [Bacillota bacterium]
MSQPASPLEISTKRESYFGVPLTPAQIGQAMRYWRTRTFITLWLTYSAFYLTRVNMSIALPFIRDEFGYSMAQLGVLSSALFFTYAVGQFVNGQLADRYGSRKLLLIGMLVSAAMNLAFGFTPATASLTFLMVIWGINGYFQAMGWPSCTKGIGNWFDPTTRGRLMGFYGTCYQIGNVYAWLLASYLVTALGWRSAFWVPGVLFILFAIHNYVRFRNTPESIGLPTLEEFTRNPDTVTTADASVETIKAAQQEEHIGFAETFKQTVANPRIWIIAMSFFFLDVIRYGFLAWAPTYMFDIGVPMGSVAWKAAALPLAGSAGAIFAGWASDKIFGTRRAPVVCVMMILLGVFSYLFTLIPAEQGTLMVLCLLAVGFFTYGPHVTLVGTVALDFGTRKAAGSAAGFIDSIGYLGAFLTGIITGYLVDWGGWSAGLWFWVLSAFAGAILVGILWGYKPEEGKYL